MLNESAAVAGIASPRPKRILQRCKRADPTRVLDQDSPNRSGHVQQCEPWPSHNQQSSKHDEEDEREMNYQYEIREDAVDQAAGVMASPEIAGGTTTGGAAGASKPIFFTSSANRGSGRNESTIG